MCSIANWDLAALPEAPTCIGPVRLPVPASPEAPAAETTSAYDVVNKTIEQMQADLEAGVMTSEQITKAYLDRIEAYDGGALGYHAYITVAKNAVDQALRGRPGPQGGGSHRRPARHPDRAQGPQRHRRTCPRRVERWR